MTTDDILRMALEADGGALADLVHSMFRSGNGIPVERITITRAQYDAARSTPAKGGE